MSRVLIIAGFVIVAVGVLWPIITKLGLGRLPGDIVIERPGVSFYVPIVTCVLVSIVLSLVAWFINR